jgi:hypothetical protein
MTINISDSGVLFEGDAVVSPGTPVEINFALPVKLWGKTGARIICAGVIARSTEYPMLAARFFGPRLHRA